MQKNLATDFTANYLHANMEDNDKGDDVLSGKLHEKVIDMDWVVEIEETLPYIEKAIDEQRRFIIENNEVYRIDKAKIINKDSVKHLIQHTNFIDNIDETGRVTPNRVLTIEREDSFETYENRFLITLIENALNFVADKYRKMVDAPTDTFNKVEMERDLVMNNQRVTFKMEYSNEVKDAEASLLDVKDYEKLSDFDRVRRIREKLNSFLNTDMMMALKKCIRVKPPINRTNLMTKNPNYKAGLDLFTYLGAYNKPGYEIVGRDFSGVMDKEVQQAVYISQGYQHFLISIATNPALKKILEEHYQENRSGRGKAGDSEIDELIENVRKEELKIRLQEIREREKIIRDQKNEIAALKREIEKRDRMIEQLKSNIKALEDQIKELRNELQKVKAELIKAKERIAELEAKVAELEAMVAALTAKVAELETIKAQLEAKITELEGIIEEQKRKIAEQERTIVAQRERINELERYVAELENTKATLEARVAELEEETAQQKQKIQEQTELIAKQVATIDTLDKEIKSATAQISELTGTLEQRDAKIAEQTAAIAGLTNDVVQLRSDLTNEKQLHQEEVEAQKAANAAEIEQLNKKFADEKAALLAAQTAEIEKLKAEHETALEKLDKQKEAEKAKIQKDADNRVKAVQKEADNRVKAAQKDAEKKAKEQIKTEVGKAQAQAKKAEKKANDTAAMYRKELKIDRGVDGLFKYDFTLGALGAQALKAEMISTAGGDMSALPNNKNLQCLYIVKDSKKVTLYSGAHRTLKVIKNFRGTTDINACRDLVVENMKNADKTCAYVTYKTVDKNEVSNFAKFLKSDADIRVTRTFHNKTQKDGKSSIGIYFYRG